MPKRPFLVMPDHECIPLGGPYRIECVQGAWYLLGRHQAFACESESVAQTRLEQVLIEHDAHALAAEALADLPVAYHVVAARS